MSVAAGPAVTKPAAAPQLAPAEQQIADFLSDILNLEAIEVGFNCFLTHRPELTAANEVTFVKCLNWRRFDLTIIQANSKEEFLKIIRNLQAENASNVDVAIKYYVAQTAANR